MALKRFLVVASAALLLLISTTNAHKAASDDDDHVPKVEDPTKITAEDASFIENLNPKKEGEEEVYYGPKDFNYCKEI